MKEGRDFYNKAQAMQSPRMIKHAKRFVHRLMRDYRNIQMVKDLFEEINEIGEKQ